MAATDVILVTSHIYLLVDLIIDWGSFQGCKRPVHKWLMASYALMLLSRLAYLVGNKFMAANSGDFLLNARQKNSTSKLFFRLMWGFFVPVSAAWNILGTYWLYEARMYSPRCLPLSNNHLWIMVIWQVLAYAWAGVHCKIGIAAWVLEQRVRAAEEDLRNVADADALSRWGDAAEQVQDYTALRRSQDAAGLSPAEIRALGCEDSELSSTEHDCGLECAICLEVVDAADSKRRLAACGHLFHRACVDLWLLRSAACPLCKTTIAPPKEAAPKSAAAAPSQHASTTTMPHAAADSNSTAARLRSGAPIEC
jgi:hypothetical protein